MSNGRSSLLLPPWATSLVTELISCHTCAKRMLQQPISVTQHCWRALPVTCHLTPTLSRSSHLTFSRHTRLLLSRLGAVTLKARVRLGHRPRRRLSCARRSSERPVTF